MNNPEVVVEALDAYQVKQEQEAAAKAKAAIEKNIISPGDQVILFNCATGLKYPMPPVTKSIDKNASIEYEQFLKA